MLLSSNLRSPTIFIARVVQLADTAVSKTVSSPFESEREYQLKKLPIADGRLPISHWPVPILNRKALRVLNQQTIQKSAIGIWKSAVGNWQSKM